MAKNWEAVCDSDKQTTPVQPTANGRSNCRGWSGCGWRALRGMVAWMTGAHCYPSPSLQQLQLPKAAIHANLRPCFSIAMQLSTLTR